MELSDGPLRVTIQRVSQDIQLPQTPWECLWVSSKDHRRICFFGYKYKIGARRIVDISGPGVAPEKVPFYIKIHYERPDLFLETRGGMPLLFSAIGSWLIHDLKFIPSISHVPLVRQLVMSNHGPVATLVFDSITMDTRVFNR